MGDSTTKTDGKQATRTLLEAEAAYREAWKAEQRASALAAVRRSLPGLERRVEEYRVELGEWEAWLAELEKMRSNFASEFASLPDDTSSLTAQEEDRVRQRRKDLLDAVAAIEGDDPRGTLVDHLAVEGKPRIPGTRRRIEEARELLAKAELELERARGQLANA